MNRSPGRLKRSGSKPPASWMSWLRSQYVISEQALQVMADLDARGRVGH